MKRPAEKIDNTRRWERSILAEALNDQIQDLHLLKGPCHVMGNSVAYIDEFPNAIFCKKMRVMGMGLAIEDVVFWQESAGMILTCGQDIDDFLWFCSCGKGWRCGLIMPAHGKRRLGDDRCIII